MQVNEAVKSIDALVGSLGDLKSALNGTLNSSDNNKIKDNADKATKTIQSMKKAFNLGAIYIGLKKAWSVGKDLASANIQMTETNNLFEVSMGKVVDQYGNLDEAQSQYYIKAMKFQDEMNEKLATNKVELMQFQAMYYSMFKSQGINKDASYFMSENLTKAGYDIASLYNLTVEDAMNKLKSGIAGQVEPLRKIGIDISESSLQKVLDDAGIAKSVQQLSYAEKEVARYVAIVNQAGQAQGDFARTMGNSANQIKIFKNQVAELKQVAGAFITNVFGNVLVYVNAIIMVLKEILKSFASLFGYDLNTGGTNISEAIGIDDLNSGLGSAINKAKEFKKQLMGFDEINNITPPSTSNGGSSGGASMGIDDKLLNSLRKWDNQMEGISGKAQQIRDRMLEWLGFHRNDKGGWELNEGLTNFEKILDVAKLIGIAILGWKVSSGITKFLSVFDILGKGEALKLAMGLTLAITGITAQYQGIERILNGEIDLFTILETIFGTTSGAFGIAQILKLLKNGKGEMLFKKPFKIGLSIMIAIGSIQILANGLKGISNGEITAENIWKAVAGSIGLGVAGAVAGLTLPVSLTIVSFSYPIS